MKNILAILGAIGGIAVLVTIAFSGFFALLTAGGRNPFM